MDLVSSRVRCARGFLSSGRLAVAPGALPRTRSSGRARRCGRSSLPHRTVGRHRALSRERRRSTCSHRSPRRALRTALAGAPRRASTDCGRRGWGVDAIGRSGRSGRSVASPPSMPKARLPRGVHETAADGVLAQGMRLCVSAHAAEERFDIPPGWGDGYSSQAFGRPRRAILPSSWSGMRPRAVPRRLGSGKSSAPMWVVPPGRRAVSGAARPPASASSPGTMESPLGSWICASSWTKVS